MWQGEEANMNDFDPKTKRRWVLVAGTGLVEGTPMEDMYAAKEIGSELAKHRYGLITGGWPGVDYLTTEAFISEINKAQLDPNNYLIQIVSKDRLVDHNFGKIVRTHPGPSR